MILVFGSINVDVVVPVPALPRAGETVLGGDYALLPGGKGANQALAARRADADVAMAGAVGHDGFAAVALELLKRDGVDLSLVREAGRPTGCAAIMVGGDGENLIAVASGANRAVTAAQVPDRALGPRTTLVCQMEVPPAETAALIGRARRLGTRIVLNLAPALPLDPSALADVDWLIANRDEAAAIAPRPGLIVTLGGAGSIAYLPGGGRLEIPALPLDPVDTTGAGDAFVGVFAAALDAGADVAGALRRASAAGGLTCLRRGAQPALPTRAEIDAAALSLAGSPETR